MASREHAFSLVELSIVLVILGLLTGGILGGQSLIRAAELRSVSTEYERYTAAVYTFRDKYFSFPGDMSNATSFWGKSTTYCNGHTGAAATPGTCNGNGDGQLNNYTASANTTSEQFSFWQHVALAGLIEGTYSGISGTAGGSHAILGTNVPRSRLSNGGWSAYNVGTSYGGDAMAFAGEYGNFFVMGGATTADKTQNLILKPEELWNIDTKVDDGRPGMGRLIAYNWAGCTTATGQTQNTADYRLTVQTNQCALFLTRL